MAYSHMVTIESLVTIDNESGFWASTIESIVPTHYDPDRHYLIFSTNLGGVLASGVMASLRFGTVPSNNLDWIYVWAPPTDAGESRYYAIAKSQKAEMIYFGDQAVGFENSYGSGGTPITIGELTAVPIEVRTFLSTSAFQHVNLASTSGDNSASFEERVGWVSQHTRGVLVRDG